MNRRCNCDWNHCQMKQSPIILICLIIAIVQYQTKFSVAADEIQIEGKMFFKSLNECHPMQEKRRRKTHLVCVNCAI